MITFRKATELDIDTITELLCKIQIDFKERNINMWQKGYPNRNSIIQDVENGEAYIAEIDSKLAGYMFICYTAEEFQSTLRGEWKDTNCSVMHRLLTDFNHRKKGLGCAMMNFWEEKAREHGCTSLRTETDETNLPMRGLMRKCGFSEMGFLTFDNSDKLAFEKVI